MKRKILSTREFFNRVFRDILIENYKNIFNCYLFITIVSTDRCYTFLESFHIIKRTPTIIKEKIDQIDQIESIEDFVYKTVNKNNSNEFCINSVRK